MVAPHHPWFVDGYAIISTNQARRTAALKAALFSQSFLAGLQANISDAI